MHWKTALYALPLIGGFCTGAWAATCSGPGGQPGPSEAALPAGIGGCMPAWLTIVVPGAAPMPSFPLPQIALGSPQALTIMQQVQAFLNGGQQAASPAVDPLLNQVQSQVQPVTQVQQVQQVPQAQVKVVQDVSANSGTVDGGMQQDYGVQAAPDNLEGGISTQSVSGTLQESYGINFGN